MASAGPYASLHLASDRYPRQHPTAQFFYRLDALPANQPTASKHWRTNWNAKQTEERHQHVQQLAVDSQWHCQPQQTQRHCCHSTWHWTHHPKTKKTVNTVALFTTQAMTSKHCCSLYVCPPQVRVWQKIESYMQDLGSRSPRKSNQQEQQMQVRWAKSDTSYKERSKFQK